MIPSRRPVRIVLPLVAAALALAPASVTRADDDAEPYADVLLRGDSLSRLPGGRDDFSRARIRLRAGVRHLLGRFAEGDLALVLAQGTDDDADAARNFDNEETDVFDLDTLALRVFATRHDELFAGRGPLPIGLGPMVWDRDLRPFGASWTHDRPVRTFDRLVAQGGWFEAEHALGEGDAELHSALVEWRIRDGAPVGGAIAVGYTEFDGLEALATSVLARTNRVENGAFVSDFELLEVQLEARVAPLGVPLRIVVDAIDNRGADDADEALHGRVVAGETAQGRWEVGVAAQRIQRDAVLAAFGDDDWWFKSAMRGTKVWLARGLPHDVVVRGVVGIERRDDLDDRLTRIIVDATWRY